jgi:hypothetical protein
MFGSRVLPRLERFICGDDGFVRKFLRGAMDFANNLVEVGWVVRSEQIARRNFFAIDDQRIFAAKLGFGFRQRSVHGGGVALVREVNEWFVFEWWQNDGHGNPHE